MVKENKYGQMGHIFKDNINKAKRMDLENLFGQMDLFMKDNLDKILLMDMVYISGSIKENIKAPG